MRRAHAPAYTRPRISSARFGRTRRRSAILGAGAHARAVQSVESRIPKRVYIFTSSRDPHSDFNLTKRERARERDSHYAHRRTFNVSSLSLPVVSSESRSFPSLSLILSLPLRIRSP